MWGERREIRLFKKLLLAGVVGAVVSLGIAGIGTASADGGDDWHHDNPCWVDATHSIDPVCWQGVYWGGVARGWIPTSYGMFDNYWQAYYFYNYNPAFFYYYNLGYYNQAFFYNVYGQPAYNVYGQPIYYQNGVPVYYQTGVVNQLPMYWWIK